jgi:hypothetical protein
MKMNPPVLGIDMQEEWRAQETTNLRSHNASHFRHTDDVHLLLVHKVGRYLRLTEAVLPKVGIRLLYL